MTQILIVTKLMDGSIKGFYQAHQSSSTHTSTRAHAFYFFTLNPATHTHYSSRLLSFILLYGSYYTTYSLLIRIHYTVVSVVVCDRTFDLCLPIKLSSTSRVPLDKYRRVSASQASLLFCRHGERQIRQDGLVAT